MKHSLLLASALLILCVSCISGPHYRLDAAAPFRVERSGRLMKATPNLVGLPEAAFHDQVESLFSLDPWHFVWTPICALWLAVSTPVYDVISLPQDLYLRNCAGLRVVVSDADGTPVEGAFVRVEENIHGASWAKLASTFLTTNGGIAYVPRKASLVRVVGVDNPGGDPHFIFLPFPNSLIDGMETSDSQPSIRITALKPGVSYSPVEVHVVREVEIERDLKLVFDASTGCVATSSGFPFSITFSQPAGYPSIRLAIESGVRPPISVQACLIPAAAAVTNLHVSALSKGLAEGFVREDAFPSPGEFKEDRLRREQWTARRIAYLKDHPDNPDRSLLWRGRFRNRVRKGLESDEWVLFKIGDQYGVLTEYFVEYGGGLETPILHLRWVFNLEPGKDWFDMDGVPVKVLGPSSDGE